MTNKEAKEIIEQNCYIFNPLNFDRTTLVNTALDRAITALEQESILDKIRAEIEKIPTAPFATAYTVKKESLNIIDKYKSESEDKE